MASVNKAIIVGYLGRDVEMRYMLDCKAVASFSVATTESWKDKTSGEKQEKTEWHNIVVWGKQAETCAQYLDKGRTVYVEGRLRTRSWDDKDGQKRYATEVVAERVQFLGGGGGGGAGGGGGGGSYGGGGGGGYGGRAPAGPSGEGPPDFGPGDDDIPF